MKGGALMKRTRVTISELKVRENDHDMIKAIFAMNGFQVPIKISKTQKPKTKHSKHQKLQIQTQKVKNWMEALAADQLRKYLTFCESEKHDAKRQSGTVNFIAEYLAMKARL